MKKMTRMGIGTRGGAGPGNIVSAPCDHRRVGREVLYAAAGVFSRPAIHPHNPRHP